MKYFSMNELLAGVNINGYSNIELLEQLGKGHVLEAYACVKLGCREWYPMASGSEYPDIIAGNGMFLQLKGMTGKIKWAGDVATSVAIDSANFYSIVSLNRGQLEVFILNSQQLIEYLLKYDKVWRIDGDFLRLQRKQMIAYLRGSCHKSWIITEAEAYVEFAMTIIKIIELSKSNRIK